MSGQANRLRLLYEVSRRLATFTDLDELLRYATRLARESFEAEGCGLLLLDEKRREFFFPVASQKESGPNSEARLAEVRFPADRGIAGWVLAHDEAVLVENTADDSRFYDGVDQRTAIHTLSILCAPLRTRSGNIGVIEVINPAAGFLNREDLEFLETLASDVAVAHEKATLYEELRGELISLRQACHVGGLILLAVGVLLGLGTALAHKARVLPWWELPTRRGMLAAFLCVGVGALLLSIARGWITAKKQ